MQSGSGSPRHDDVGGHDAGRYGDAVGPEVGRRGDGPEVGRRDAAATGPEVGGGDVARDDAGRGQLGTCGRSGGGHAGRPRRADDGRSATTLGAAAMVLILTGMFLAAVTGAAPASAAASSVARSAGTSVTTATGGAYTPIRPSRVAVRRLPANAPRGVQVTGRGRVPRRGVAAVLVRLSVSREPAAGSLTAWRDRTRRPATAAVQYAARRPASADALVAVSPAGRIVLRASTRARVRVDVLGWVSSRAVGPGGVTLVAPHRIRARIGAHRGVTLATRTAGSGVAAVVGTLAVVNPGRAGSVTAFAVGTARPADPTLSFGAHARVSTLAVPSSGPDGRVRVYNSARAAVTVTFDVAGWVAAGVPATIGAVQPLVPARAASGVRIPRGTTRTISLTPRTGVPLRHVRAAIVQFTVSGRRRGTVSAWAAGRRPREAGLVVGPGRTVVTDVVPVSSTGTIRFGNDTPARVRVGVDVLGYVTASAPVPPATSTGRYVRNVTATGSTDADTMRAEGAQDAQQGSRLVLLEFGAQTVTSPLSPSDPGVLLTGSTDNRIPYARVVELVDAYLAGFHAADPGLSARIAVGTNTDGAWTVGADTYYAPSDRGSDWATKVVLPLRADAATSAPGLDVVGADDIEAGFAAAPDQVQAWERAFLAEGGRSLQLVVNPSLDGCPTDYASTATTCLPVRSSSGAVVAWTLAQYASIVHGLAPYRITVLPQVYSDADAVKWALLDRAARGRLRFAGSLTEQAADAASFAPGTGWLALWRALSTVVAAPSLPQAVDLRADTA